MFGDDRRNLLGASSGGFRVAELNEVNEVAKPRLSTGD